MSRPTSRLLPLFSWLVLCFLVALLNAQVTDPGEWYQALDKPAWTPPGWLFGPAWTLLYTLMGVAAFLVWEHRRTPLARLALGLFLLQLAFNAAWSWLFFQQQAIGLALIDLAALWLALAATLVVFFRVRPAAGYLLVPYLLWVTYAAALNGAIVALNP